MAGPWEAFQSAAPAEEPEGPWKQYKPLAPQPQGPTPPGSPSNPILIQSLARQAVKPITDIPGEYSKQVNEAVQLMGQGVSDIATPGKRLAGAAETGIGAFDYTMSPINAPLHTILGKPVEQATGIPSSWTETAASLLIPGANLSKAGSAGKAALRPLEAVLSPDTLSPEAESAAGSIRAAGGQAARDTAQTAAEMEPYHRVVNALPVPTRLQFMNYVEGRSAGAQLANPQLRPLADTLRAAFKKREAKLLALPSKAQAEFVEDYYPHFWKDPNAANQFVQKWGAAAKQGSGASLRKRTVPTIADGIAAGLVPATTDPIEATIRYVTSMDRFIASTEVLDTAKANGTVRYVRPATMGASGHPEGSFRAPPGWKPLQGRGATDATGAQAYAPADWADVYNNFISKGVHANEHAGRLYDAAQSASNAITSLELGLSGYHAFTMANESVISEVARGISQLVGGKPLKAIGTAASAVTAPIRTAMKGHKFEQVYLGRTPGAPDYRKIVDLGTKAGMRAVGKRHAPDYRFSAMGSFWTAFKRGALKQEMQQSLASITGPLSAAREAGRVIGRTMETVAQPIFEKYIPKLKNGAFYDAMHDWLQANPTATYDTQVKQARLIWDSIDNRFGEMVQDNIFWNKTLKQAATLAMRSYSWNLGTVREIGGGIRDIARGEWTPKAAYVVALPMVVGTMNAVYQYIKSGKSPESVDDLVAGRSGGTQPGFAGRGTVPERVMMPGYQKDVLGWYHDWKQEAANKLATGPTMLLEGLRGTDWRGDPIARPDATVPQWLSDYFNWVIQSAGTPISVRQLLQGEKAGSHISTLEMLMGVRPAPTYLQDPEGYKHGMTYIEKKKWKTKQYHDRKQQQQYGGPNE